MVKRTRIAKKKTASTAILDDDKGITRIYSSQC
jgi:hypothetical protein